MSVPLSEMVLKPRRPIWRRLELAMGILTRQQDETFVISSDHIINGPPSKRAPNKVNGPYLVWTGTAWSDNMSEALCFTSLDDADEYVRANYARLSG